MKRLPPYPVQFTVNDVVEFWSVVAPDTYRRSGEQTNFYSSPLSVAILRIGIVHDTLSVTAKEHARLISESYDREVRTTGRLFDAIRNGDPLSQDDMKLLFDLYTDRSIRRSLVPRPLREPVDHHLEFLNRALNPSRRTEWLRRYEEQLWLGDPNV